MARLAVKSVNQPFSHVFVREDGPAAKESVASIPRDNSRRSSACRDCDSIRSRSPHNRAVARVIKVVTMAEIQQRSHLHTVVGGGKTKVIDRIVRHRERVEFNLARFENRNLNRSRPRDPSRHRRGAGARRSRRCAVRKHRRSRAFWLR